MIVYKQQKPWNLQPVKLIPYTVCPVWPLTLIGGIYFLGEISAPYLMPVKQLDKLDLSLGDLDAPHGVHPY